MQRWYLLLLLPLAATVLAADEEPPLARVIDNTSVRIPAHTVAPQYPRKARRDRIEGEVQVCFHVDKKGRPRRIAVRRSTNRAFERPSIKALEANLQQSGARLSSPRALC